MGYEFSAVTGFTTTPSIRAPSEHLLVTRLDRLARSTRDLLNIVHAVGERGAAFKSLADAWADTTTPHGKLMLTIWAAWPNLSAA